MEKCSKWWYNNSPIILTTGLTQTTPTYVAILEIVLKFIVVLGILVILIYNIHCKYKTINHYIKKRYSQNNNNDNHNNPDDFKTDMATYKEEIAGLGVNSLPDSQTIGNAMGKILPFIKPK